MSNFIIFAYLKSCFLSHDLFGAANNDLSLYKSLQRFKKYDPKVSAATTKVLRRHPWYLTAELISLALFDKDLPEDERTALALKIGALPDLPEMDIHKPELPSFTLSSVPSDFVVPRTVLLFDLIEIPRSFLLLDDWQLQPEYTLAQDTLKNLSTTNDSAEIALSLDTSVNEKITRNEESYQELLLVIAAHRKKYALKTKTDLKLLR